MGIDNLPRRSLERCVDLLHRRYRSGRQADSNELVRLVGGTGEVGEGSGVEVGLWSCSGGGELQRERAELVCVLCGRRLVGLVLLNGCLGFAAELQRLRGELAGFGRGSGRGEATRMAGGGMGMSIGQRRSGWWLTEATG